MGKAQVFSGLVILEMPTLDKLPHFISKHCAIPPERKKINHS